MKTLLKVFLSTICIIISFNTHAQNLQELFIEKLDSKAAYDIHAGSECKPGDIVVTIKSMISDLQFESNVIDIQPPVYDDINHEYVFCHDPGDFILTVKSTNHTSKNVVIDGESAKYAFAVESKSSRGAIFFRTIPNNALVDFRLQGLAPQLTGFPIEMTAGEYTVKISKNGYTSIDTTIIVPSDGASKSIDLIMEQNFARILLDVTTADKSSFSMYPIIEIDTAHIFMADLLDQYKIKSFDDTGELEYFKIYKGGYVPVPAGSYSIRINIPGFKTYTTRLQTVKGTTTPLKVSLEPIVGYLTVIDSRNALDAKVLLDGEEIGTVPMHKHKVRIGNHCLAFKKEGYRTPQEEYFITIDENIEQEMAIEMSLFLIYHITSSPLGAEVFDNNQRIGFTPIDIKLNEGKHEVIVRKTDFFDYQQVFLVSENNIASDTIRVTLENTHPIKIVSEEYELKIVVKRNDTIISSKSKTPAEIQLPYGKYTLELYKKKHRGYSGSFIHNGNVNEVKAPFYSRGTFTSLVGDYLLGQKAYTEKEEGRINYYNIIAKAHFGRFNIVPGLSTSIFRTSIFQVQKDYKGQGIEKKVDGEDVITIENSNYPDFMFSGSCLFLNGEFRVGGYFYDYMGVCALASYAWSPNMTSFLNFSHISGHDLFLGAEVTSRISYFNINIKLGMELYKGEYNFLINGDKEKFYSDPFKVSGFVFSIGFTLGQSVSRGNNMLKVW